MNKTYKVTKTCWWVVKLDGLYADGLRRWYPYEHAFLFDTKKWAKDHAGTFHGQTTKVVRRTITRRVACE